MQRIRVVNRISAIQLQKDPRVKDCILQQMSVSFSKEMFKNECFKITETLLPNDWGTSDNEKEITIEGFVLTPEEVKKVFILLNRIENYAPGDDIDKLQLILNPLKKRVM